MTKAERRGSRKSKRKEEEEDVLTRYGLVRCEAEMRLLERKGAARLGVV